MYYVKGKFRGYHSGIKSKISKNILKIGFCKSNLLWTKEYFEEGPWLSLKNIFLFRILWILYIKYSKKYTNIILSKRKLSFNVKRYFIAKINECKCYLTLQTLSTS